jgi:hypothetical protein
MALVAIFLVAVARHLSPQDPRVATWFDEYFRMWGVSYDELMSNHFRGSWCTVGTLVSTYSREFRGTGDASQVTPDFDYDMDFGVPGNSERGLSSSDTSSNGQSVTPPASTDTREILDGSASRISSGQHLIHYDSQLLRGFTDFLRPPGRLTKGILADIQLVGEEEATERLGALAGATEINSALHPCSSSRGRSHVAEGGFVGERIMRAHLPALVTNGLTGQSPMGLSSQDLYARMVNSGYTGVSEESQSAIDSPSLARASPRSGSSPVTKMDTHSIADHNATFSVQSQSRYGSRLSPQSVLPYASQAVDDVDLGWRT